MSTRLTAVLDEPYLRFCRPCDAVHIYEQPFRLAALRAGLELQAGHLAAGAAAGSRAGAGGRGAASGSTSSARYLRLLGPATPQHVAGYLDAPVKDVKAHWPDDAVEVTVDGERRWLLAEDVDRLDDRRPTVTRLLGAVRPLPAGAGPLARSCPTADRAKDLWRTLGRPGGVLADGEIAGTWRARKAGPRSPSRSSSGPGGPSGARRAGRAAGRLPRAARWPS